MSMRCHRVLNLVEKPAPDKAPSNLAIAGRYAFSPLIFDLLRRVKADARGEIQLTDAIQLMCEEGKRVLAVVLPNDEKRYDIGNFPSYFETFVEFALADPLYGYRGERDVSLLPGENRSLIETSGPSFIRRAWFQFYDDKLYIMTFTLDPEKIDYYSVYSKLVAKYGEPASLDPRKAVWGDDKTTLSLERPLTVSAWTGASRTRPRAIEPPP